jgi:hypothetical protein
MAKVIAPPTGIGQDSMPLSESYPGEALRQNETLKNI